MSAAYSTEWKKSTRVGLLKKKKKKNKRKKKSSSFNNVLCWFKLCLHGEEFWGKANGVIGIKPSDAFFQELFWDEDIVPWTRPLPWRGMQLSLLCQDRFEPNAPFSTLHLCETRLHLLAWHNNHIWTTETASSTLPASASRVLILVSKSLARYHTIFTI